MLSANELRLGTVVACPALDAGSLPCTVESMAANCLNPHFTGQDEEDYLARKFITVFSKFQHQRD